jgi:3-hydroxybutyryl-CoA dehydratase
MMQVGEAAEVTRTFGQDEVEAFARLAGTPPGAAVPEPLIGALFSYLLGVKLPGFGTNYLKQEMRFHAAAAPGAALTARVEVTRLRPEKHLADLATTCRDGEGRLICEGRALVLVRDVER